MSSIVFPCITMKLSFLPTCTLVILQRTVTTVMILNRRLECKRRWITRSWSCCISITGVINLQFPKQRQEVPGVHDKKIPGVHRQKVLGVPREVRVAAGFGPGSAGRSGATSSGRGNGMNQALTVTVYTNLQSTDGRRSSRQSRREDHSLQSQPGGLLDDFTGIDPSTDPPSF